MHQVGRPDGRDSQGRLWIYRPSIDLIVGCAAWSAPLLLLGGLGQSAFGVRGWAVAFYALALAFNYPHYMATVYRAYHTKAELAKYRIFTVHITALLCLVAVFSHVWPALVPWIFTLYVTWSPWHYTGQNFGLLMMFARRGGLAPTDGERRALYLGFLASYALLFITLHTAQSGPSTDPLIRSLGIAPWLAGPARGVCLAAFAGFSGVTLVRMSARASGAAMLAPLTLFTTQGLWFVAPAVAEWLTGAHVSQARYSTGVLALMHSAQYLWITSYYARREAEASPETQWRPWSYAASLVAGGVALFVPGPWVASYLFRFDLTTSMLIFTAVVNIHHFILDGAIWKLRDSRIAALMIAGDPHRTDNASSRLAAGVAGTGRAAFGIARWLVGASLSRASRVAALVVLCALAVVDQARFVLSTDERNLTALVRAATLNPHDRSVQARRARLLIEQGRLQEAYDMYRGYLQGGGDAGRDDDALVNAGLLALGLHKEDDAVMWWQRASDRSPGETNAARYLAQLWAARAERLEQSGEATAAARALQRALALDARLGDRKSEGTDWFNYGQFLRRRGVEPRLVLACLLKSEALFEAAEDSRLETVRQVRAAVERDAHGAGDLARRDLAGALAAALRSY